MIISRKRVARLMRKAGLQGVSRRRAYTVTTRRDARQQPAPDLVQRQFRADLPNTLWVADMTYVPTWSGFIYLAVILDAWSRRVVGWSIGEQMNADLVLGALNMALQQRRPEQVIHHTITMNIRGNSYRLKDKLKAGLVRPAENPSVE
jgi:putative transposase